MSSIELDHTNDRFIEFSNANFDRIYDEISHPIVTQRYVLKDGKLTTIGTTTNIGIACYVLEILCKSKFKNVFSKKIQDKWIQILLNQILNASIRFKRCLFWRWELKPLRTDYNYPPDWDDTCKAIDAINSYEKYYKKILALKMPNERLIYHLFKKSIYKDNNAGQEKKIYCKNDISLYMFVSDLKQKQNNTEDILVTAVTIRSILENFRSLDKNFLELLKKLFERVVEVAEIGIEKKIPFNSLSKCYFSWGLFILILLDIGKYFHGKSIIIENIAFKYVHNKLFTKTLPTCIFGNLIVNEINYAKLVAIQLGLNPKIYLKGEYIENSGLSNFYKPQIIYQHRRLGHYYGSPVWTFLLDLYVSKMQYEAYEK